MHRDTLARRIVRWLALGIVPALGAGTRLHAQRIERDSAEVPVAARALPRGTVLQPADMVTSVRLVRRGGAGSLGPQAGWVTRRVIRAGEILAAPAVVPPPTIALGERVDFIVMRGGIQISLPATAAFAATLGDTVAVRLRSHIRATGIVAGPARVIALNP